MSTSYFSRTPASTGDRKTFTFSTWIKKSDASARFQLLFMANNYTGSNLNSGIYFNPSNQLNIQTVNNGANAYILTTTQVFRDTSAWYHIVVAFDTTQATSSNRIKVYVNGSQVTAFDTATYPTQNLDTVYNQISIPQVIGYRDSDVSSYYYDGLIANTILIDGQQLDASSFGETDATTGIWKPKLYTGSYGTNGFFLKFENSGSLGLDSSGNGNNFTVNGTPTQTVDTPSNVFCTLNPLSRQSYTFSNGNNTISRGASTFQSTAIATLSTSKGKWYWEVKLVSGQSAYPRIGVYKNENQDNHVIQEYLGNYNGNTSKWWGSGGATNKYGTGQTDINTSYASYTNGDILHFAMDLDNGKMWYGKNGTWYTNTTTTTTSLAISNGSATPAYTDLGTGSFWTPAIFGNENADVWSANFGNGFFGTTAISSPYSDGAGYGKFQYQPPTGYYALCTKNINVYG